MAEATMCFRPPSGYDEDFVNAVEEDCHCLICHLPLKEPVLTRCGHRFCEQCLEEHNRRQKDRGQSLTCPVDRQGLDRDRDVFPDKATERKILSFAVRCPSDGCEWTGELRNKEVHLGSCPFKLVLCANDNCEVTVQRQNLEQHLTVKCPWKVLKCDYCSELKPKCQMQGHIKQCIKFPVTCPNGCGSSIPGETVSTHINDKCPLNIISCPYAHMGCETKVQRQAVESHLESAMRIHFDLACVKLSDTEDTLKKTEAKLKETQFELNDAKVRLNRTEDKLSNTGVKLNDTKVELNKAIELLREKATQKVDSRPFIWKIEGFSEILRQAKTGGTETISSDAFYTETRTKSYGYKFKVIINPNGYGSAKNTHLSVFIVVMKGEYDAILPWPLSKKVKFTLIDQQQDPGKRENVAMELITNSLPNFARPVTKENAGRGFREFISHEKLNSRRYIVDDTLFLQVQISSPSS